MTTASEDLSVGPLGLQVWAQDYSGCGGFTEPRPITVGGLAGVQCGDNSRFGGGSYQFPVRAADGRVVGSVFISWSCAFDERGIFDLKPPPAADKARAARLADQITATIARNYLSATSV